MFHLLLDKALHELSLGSLMLSQYSSITHDKTTLEPHQFPVEPHVVEGQLAVAPNVDRLGRLDDDRLDVALAAGAAAVEQVRQVDAELDAEVEKRLMELKNLLVEKQV